MHKAVISGAFTLALTTGALASTPASASSSPTYPSPSPQLPKGVKVIDGATYARQHMPKMSNDAHLLTEMRRLTRRLKNDKNVEAVNLDSTTTTIVITVRPGTAKNYRHYGKGVKVVEHPYSSGELAKQMERMGSSKASLEKKYGVKLNGVMELPLESDGLTVDVATPLSIGTKKKLQANLRRDGYFVSSITVNENVMKNTSDTSGATISSIPAKTLSQTTTDGSVNRLSSDYSGSLMIADALNTDGTQMYDKNDTKRTTPLRRFCTAGIPLFSLKTSGIVPTTARHCKNEGPLDNTFWRAFGSHDQSWRPTEGSLRSIYDYGFPVEESKEGDKTSLGQALVLKGQRFSNIYLLGRRENSYPTTIKYDYDLYINTDVLDQINNQGDSLYGLTLCTEGGNSGEHCGLKLDGTVNNFKDDGFGASLNYVAKITQNTTMTTDNKRIAITSGDSGGPVVLMVNNSNNTKDKMTEIPEGVYPIGMIQGSSSDDKITTSDTFSATKDNLTDAYTQVNFTPISGIVNDFSSKGYSYEG